MDFQKEFEKFKPFEDEVVINDFSFAFDGLTAEDLSSEFTGDFDSDYSNYIAMRNGKKSTAQRFKHHAIKKAKKISKPISIWVPENRDVHIVGGQKMCFEKAHDPNDVIVLEINNPNSFDITVDLFRPSTPYLYTQSTRLNINDLVVVAGGQTVLYTDILAYLTANITRLTKMHVNVSSETQLNQPLACKSFNFRADQFIRIKPVAQNRSLFQYEALSVDIDLDTVLNAPFIIDGSQYFQYTVLAGQNVTLGFDFTQIRLRDAFLDAMESEKFELK